jgi:ATP-dependent Clp protease ATP-binding subunit ClpA
MNGYNFTDRVRKVLQIAREEAARMQHGYVGTEHILLAILHEGEGVAAATLINLGVNFDEVTQHVHNTVKKGDYRGDTHDLPYTSRAKKVLELSMSEARELNHHYVGTEHLLLGVLREEKGIGAQALTEVGIDVTMARTEVRRLLGEDEALHLPSQEPPREETPRELDQRFKTAIALIELHQRRFGKYPESLSELQFLGWRDQDLSRRFLYERLAEGYSLEIRIPKDHKLALSYPADFWRGLGIRRTNVGRSGPS